MKAGLGAENNRPDTGRMDLFNDTAGSGYKHQKLQKRQAVTGRLRENGDRRRCRHGSHSSKTSSRTVHMTRGCTRGPRSVKETGGLEEGRRERPWVSTEDGIPISMAWLLSEVSQ